MTQTPPGWHPDPAGQTPGQPPLLRWWDGTAWTEHVAPARRTTPPPYEKPFGQPPAHQQSRRYADQARPPAPTTPDGQPLAGWWWRALAYLIDTFVVGVVGNIVSLPTQVGVQDDIGDLSDETQRRLDANPDDTGAVGDFFHGMLDIMRDHAVGLIVPGLVVGFIYFAVMLRWKGATVGMLATGLRVRLRERPGRLPWRAVVVRVVVQTVLPSLLMAVGLVSGFEVLIVLLAAGGSLFQLLNYLWPVWDPKRQALHDKAAGTNVVRPR